jgi:uridine phosphorylase
MPSVDPAEAPILEFDPSPTAIIEPGDHLPAAEEMPTHAVICFFREVIDRLCVRAGARILTTLVAEHGTHPIYEQTIEGRRLAVFHPGVGAPLAAGFLEEAIAHGIRTVVACGGAGALVPDLTMGHVVVPTAAIRDEGTSYHYLPASRQVAPSPTAVVAIEDTLRRHGVAYRTGATWTTDAIYRETRAKAAARVAEGCLTVEMEAAAFFAVAAFRGITFGQLLYAGDDLSAEEWDDRGWLDHTEGRERLFLLAAEACLSLP